MAHVLLPHDWLTLQLTGELVTDRGDASGTGYWSPSAGGYVADVFALLGIDPDVVNELIQHLGAKRVDSGANVVAGSKGSPARKAATPSL